MIEGKCWNCGKMNKIQEDGYCWCICRDIGGRGMWYHPLEKKEKPDQEQLFLDEEESVE